MRCPKKKCKHLPLPKCEKFRYVDDILNTYWKEVPPLHLVTMLLQCVPNLAMHTFCFQTIWETWIRSENCSYELLDKLWLQLKKKHTLNGYWLHFNQSYTPPFYPKIKNIQPVGLRWYLDHEVEIDIVSVAHWGGGYNNLLSSTHLALKREIIHWLARNYLMDHILTAWFPFPIAHIIETLVPVNHWFWPTSPSRELHCLFVDVQLCLREFGYHYCAKIKC